MNTRQLQYVLKVAEERSFSEAAKKLYVSQPSLSEFIRKVEKELGYELFDRTVTPLKLTVAGEVYVETAHEILTLERTMGTRLRDMDEAQYGKLAVGVSPYSSFMPSVLKSFFDVFPNYEVEIQDKVGTTERLQLLEQGQLDLCIQPISDALGSKYTVEEIMMDDMLLVVPSEYPINDALLRQSDGASPLPSIGLESLAMLKDVPFVLVDESMNLRKNANKLFDRAGIKPNIQVVCHKSEGCLDMAIAGVGATIVQLSLIKYRELRQNANYYLIRQDLVKRRFAAIHIQGRYLPKAAQVFIDILKTF